MNLSKDIWENVEYVAKPLGVLLVIVIITTARKNLKWVNCMGDINAVAAMRR